jgi:hypothetical protein
MTGNGVRTWTGDEKSLVELRRKSAKMLDLRAVFHDLSRLNRQGCCNGPDNSGEMMCCSV